MSLVMMCNLHEMLLFLNQFNSVKIKTQYYLWLKPTTYKHLHVQTPFLQLNVTQPFKLWTFSFNFVSFSILRTITNAPWYVTNHTLHTDLNIPYVSDVINERINKHLSKLESHPNPLVGTLKQPTRNRRLKRRWTSDLHD